MGGNSLSSRHAPFRVPFPATNNSSPQLTRFLLASPYSSPARPQDPRVLFLDEPTSGLDSEMAMEVVETLRALCAGGRTVALTIHQPNSLITAKFDDFILLAAGRAVFGGAWADSAPFFAAGGLTLPPATNPTDFFLAVLQDSAAAEALADRQADRAAKRGALHHVRHIVLAGQLHDDVVGIDRRPQHVHELPVGNGRDRRQRPLHVPVMTEIDGQAAEQRRQL